MRTFIFLFLLLNVLTVYAGTVPKETYNSCGRGGISYIDNVSKAQCISYLADAQSPYHTFVYRRAEISGSRIHFYGAWWKNGIFYRHEGALGSALLPVESCPPSHPIETEDNTCSDGNDDPCSERAGQSAGDVWGHDGQSGASFCKNSCEAVVGAQYACSDQIDGYQCVYKSTFTGSSCSNSGDFDGDGGEGSGWENPDENPDGGDNGTGDGTDNGTDNGGGDGGDNGTGDGTDNGTGDGTDEIPDETGDEWTREDIRYFQGALNSIDDVLYNSDGTLLDMSDYMREMTMSYADGVELDSERNSRLEEQAKKMDESLLLDIERNTSLNTANTALGQANDSLGSIGTQLEQLIDLASDGECDPSVESCEEIINETGCDAFVCEGQPYLCYLSRKTWEQQCHVTRFLNGQEVQATKNDFNQVIEDHQPDSLNLGEIDISTSLERYTTGNGVNFGGGGCPAPDVVSNKLFSFTIDYQPFCDLAGIIKLFVNMFALISSGLMIAKHS
ncbi:virulence factor TspB C-terminal domain-related protein [Thaumasiovibrio sp. DFM-14]|uniref:virulence factor TspB C-terminal domain-related protein n=1 Tax=Thaumasiovibrio sp. DFM-14 TaxID=3384792 RepID=UPI0039A03E4E